MQCYLFFIFYSTELRFGPFPEGSAALTLKGPLRFGPLRLPRESYQIRTYTETRTLASRYANWRWDKVENRKDGRRDDGDGNNLLEVDRLPGH